MSRFKEAYRNVAIRPSGYGSGVPSAIPISPLSVEDMQKLLDVMRGAQVPPVVRLPSDEEVLARLKDAELIMEMLRRGYAVLKCPEPGRAPETLSDG